MFGKSRRGSEADTSEHRLTALPPTDTTPFKWTSSSIEESSSAFEGFVRDPLPNIKKTEQFRVDLHQTSLQTTARDQTTAIETHRSSDTGLVHRISSEEHRLLLLPLLPKSPHSTPLSRPAQGKDLRRLAETDI
ncbi:hypothetical protein M0R45_008879 [Rubus argutus]|uniref:Uncharacterized protein n=1 Tax=Rubus argutus TaxID=59490 RepID=A0AAW1Y2K2_RUBAR